MPITLDSSGYDATNEFRIAAAVHLKGAEVLVTRLRAALEESGETLEPKQTVLWAVSLARAKALLEIGVPHPDLVLNFQGHTDEFHEFLTVTNKAIILLHQGERANQEVPGVALEIESLRQDICELIYGEGNT